MTMHVAISGWLLGEPSGANRRLLALVSHAAASLAPNERITVLHRRDWRPPSTFADRVAWRPIEIPASPSLRRVLAERRVLPRLLRELGATVLDHGFLPLPSVPIPTCLLVHDTRGVDGLSRWPKAIAHRVLRRSCEHATVVVVPSEWTAARVRAACERAPRIVVVPNGVELPPPSPDALGEHLLHVGHLEPRKNLDVVVRALARVPVEQRRHLWLVGRDAGAGTGLRRLAAELGVAANVRFVGTLGEPALQQLYATARAVVVPSLHEGFGLAALEALAHGRPVLASAAGALPEVCGAHATLLPPHDVDAWAQALGTNLDDSEATRATRRSHAAEFDWAAAARRLVAAWREAHGGNQRTSQTMPTTMPTASNNTPA